MNRLKKHTDSPAEAYPEPWFKFQDEHPEHFASVFAAGSAGADDGEGLPGECAYDPAYEDGRITMQEAKIREQTIGECLRNEKLRAEIEVVRNNLFTKTQLKDLMTEKDQIILNVIKTLPEIAAASYTGGDKGKVRKHAKGWIKQLMDAINQKVKESQA